MECKQVFHTLCEKLISSPVLAIYNPQRETELHCDASSSGFGGILLQKQNDDKFHPVAYFSKATSKDESRYHSYELETLAIIYSLEKFHTYVDGIPFRMITDCNSLALTLERQKTSPRIARWALQLEKYNYTIQHRSGNLMNHVDTLSRYFCKPINENKHAPIISVIDSDDVDLQLQMTQNPDENITRLRKKLEKYK